MARRRTAFVALLCGIQLAACGGGSSSSSAMPTRAEVKASLDSIVTTGVTGVLLRLGGPFGRELYRSGVADLDGGRRARSTDTFRIASIAKAFSGAVILSLVRDGGLSLDDTVERWLPGALPAGDQVRVRELLDHTSGVFNYTDDAEFAAEFSADPLHVYTPMQLVEAAARHPLNFPPGTAYAYSNTDNILVGLIAEAASGESYTALLQSRVFAPLGLDHTALPSEPQLPQPFIHGYLDADGAIEDVSEAISPTGAWASGAVISTADDLSRFIGALVAGDLYGPALRTEAMRTVAGDSQPPGPPGPGTNQSGLGLFRYDTACATMWGHTGRFPGYRNYALATADGSRTLVLTVNEEPAPAAADTAILQTLDLAICRLGDL